MPKKTIRVRAGEGRLVVFPVRVLAAPGARPYLLEGDDVVEVERCSFVNKRLRARDLVEVSRDTRNDPNLVDRTPTFTTAAGPESVPVVQPDEDEEG